MKPGPSFSSTSSSGTANQDYLLSPCLLEQHSLAVQLDNTGFPTATDIMSLTMSTASKDTQ